MGSIPADVGLLSKIQSNRNLNYLDGYIFLQLKDKKTSKNLISTSFIHP